MKLHFKNTTLILVFVLVASFLSVMLVSSDLNRTNGTSNGTPTAGGCVPGGCSGQLCVDENEASNIVTTCEYSESYACYKSASCERQPDGECGWTMTEELQSCLDSSDDSEEVLFF